MEEHSTADREVSGSNPDVPLWDDFAEVLACSKFILFSFYVIINVKTDLIYGF